MKNQPAQVKVNENLTWESARVDSFLMDFDCPPPQPVSDFTPQWYRDLKGDLQLYRDDQWRYNHTARYCKGLQGIRNLGWTMPLPVDITSEQNTISRKIVVPEMLYGTHWNDKNELGEHIWDITLIFWPWRARLKKGWKMMTMAYPLDWSPDWFSFAGIPPPNYSINLEKNSIGNMYQWEQPLDTDTYDYYNIETVHAFRKESMIPKGTLTFSLVIIPEETSQ
jgi:hypothetical protein